MELPADRVAHAIAADKVQISLCSNLAAEVVATAGYDWALIDMEHSASDCLLVLSQLQAVATARMTALVAVE